MTKRTHRVRAHTRGSMKAHFVEPKRPDLEMIPYTSEDYTLEEAQRQARELRKEGKHKRVEIRRKRQENGRQFARVYVSRN